MITILAAGGLTSIIDNFGVSLPLLTAQFINFVLVILILKIFAFGPIQAMLEQRKNRIAEGEEKLKRIEKQLAESEATTAATLEKANNDAKRLIEEAKESASALTEEKTQEAIKAYTSKAFDILESISITDSSKSILRDFGIWLMNRRV